MRFRTAFSILLILAFSASGCERISISLLPTPVQTDAPSRKKTPTRTPRLTPTPQDKVGVDKSALKGVTINVWHSWGSPQRELFEAQIAEFNRRNLWGISVRAQPYPDWATLFDTVNQSIKMDDPPDLVVALPEYALAWEAQDSVMDLTDYVNHPEWGLSPDKIADIPQVFWEQDQAGMKRLGLPAERSTRLLFYNARWARELGFASAPENEREFRSQTCAANKQFRSDSLLSNDGYGGWIVDSDPQTALSWMNSFGGGVINENAYDFNTAENSATLTYLKDLFDDSCAWIYTGLDHYAPLAGRHALFMSGDLTELGDQANAFSLANNSDDWTVIAFPGSDKKSILTYGPSFTVLKGSPEKQLAAWLFARWMLQPDVQAQWVKTTGMLPLRKSSMKSLEGYASSHPQWAQAVDLLDLAVIQPQKASWRTIKYVLGDGMYSIFRLNLPLNDISVVLDEMQATAEELSK
jgi:multiple sugar transport system substrate-binding protein